MAGKRKVYGAAFKAKVALEALKGLTPINVLASEYGVQPNQISLWKKQMKDNVSEIFKNRRGRTKEKEDQTERKLYEEIGRLKVELDWLKKKADLS